MGQGCNKPWSQALFARLIHPNLREAIFGIYLPESYEEWKTYPHIIQVCNDCIKKLSRDRVTLGYRKRNGKLVAYVREQHY